MKNKNSDLAFVLIATATIALVISMAFVILGISAAVPGLICLFSAGGSLLIGSDNKNRSDNKARSKVQSKVR